MDKYRYIPTHDVKFKKFIKEIGINIKKMRIESGLVQQDLSVRAEISECTLSELERGVRNNVSVMILSKIGLALGYRINITFTKL